MATINDDLHTLRRPKKRDQQVGPTSTVREDSAVRNAVAETSSAKPAKSEEEDDVDLQVLAEKVYALLKKELIIERERLHRDSQWFRRIR